MTVGELQSHLRSLPDDMEVGVESSIRVTDAPDSDTDALEGHKVNGAFVMDFSEGDKGQKVLLLQIDREEDSVGRWSN